jgi:hypothetical protein
VDKYVNATKMIEKIDEKIGSLKDKYGELPDCVEVRDVLYCRKVLDLAPAAPIADYRPENAIPVTFNGKIVGILKSINPNFAEIVVKINFCGCEFVDGELASVEILKEPLDKWEERYGNAIRDSKEQ